MEAVPGDYLFLEWENYVFVQYIPWIMLFVINQWIGSAFVNLMAIT